METGFAVLMRKSCGANHFIYTTVYFVTSIADAEKTGKSEMARCSSYVKYLILPAIRLKDGKVFLLVDSLLSKLA